MNNQKFLIKINKKISLIETNKNINKPFSL